MKPYFSENGIQIFHGDALEILPGLPDGIGALITDPPYSSGGAFRSDRVQGTVRKYVNSDTASHRAEFDGDHRDQRSFFAWSTLWLAASAKLLEQTGIAAVFTDWRQLPTTSDAFQAGGFVQRGISVWDKGRGARPIRGAFRTQAEFIVWGTLGAHDPERNDVTLDGVGVYAAPIVTDKRHIAEKPLAVMLWLAELCPAGGTILDPFMGSGTTLEAAKRSGRSGIGIDVSEQNCELAAERLSQGVLFE